MNASVDLETLDPSDQFGKERIERLAEQARSVRGPVLLATAVVGAFFWDSVPPAYVVAWAVLVLVLREVRAEALKRLSAAYQADQLAPERATQLAALSNAVLGLGFGCAALFMPFNSPERNAIVTMILVSLAAGAMTTSATVLSAYLAFACAALVPVALAWLLAGTGFDVAIAALIVLFIKVQYGFARKNGETYQESFVMRFERDQKARELEREKGALTELAQQLAAARDVAEQADAAKTRFLAAASHDLRQPIFSLGLHAFLLMRKSGVSPLMQHAHEIKAQSDTLGSMLDRLLDISEMDLDSRPPSLSDVPLAPMLSRQIQLRLAAARDKGLTLSLSCPHTLSVRTDVLDFERVTANLLDNAIKYTDRGSVVVAAFSEEEDVVLEVKDTGPGIAVEDHRRVFEDFYQVGNPERDRRKGHGLGLGIVRRICTRLGYAIELESVPGRGCTFTLRLPDAARLAEPQATREEPVLPALNGVRILLIEDDLTLRAALSDTLCLAGAVLTVATTANEARQQSATLAPQIIVADYRLPNDETGVDAIETVRAKWGPIPALLLSGETSPATLRSMTNSGVPVLRKPIAAERLLRHIADSLPVPVVL